MIIIHYDEIALKKSNRKFFEDKLVNSIKESLMDFNVGSIRRCYGYLLVSSVTEEDFSLIKDILKKIPGISNFAYTYSCEKDFDAMKGALAFFSKDLEKAHNFAIDVRKSDHKFSLSSMECERELGGIVLEKYPNLSVRLKNPECTIYYDITHTCIFVYSEKIQGVGGLPVGSVGNMFCLLSGGFDSPVAAYFMMRRGVKVSFIHFRNSTKQSSSVENKIIDLVRVLSKVQGCSLLYIVPFESIQREIISLVPSEYRMIVYRRYMIRIAEQISKANNAKGLITGDSMGQVASQTLENLTSVHAVAKSFIASPLIGMNKRDIILCAHSLGTYKISSLPYEDCCSLFVSDHPALRSTPDEITRLESSLDEDSLIKEVLPMIQKYELS